ncbi:MAG: hypothetical protein HY908_09925 [Myxococcales bacterium]|nr:hypothetical protein [Myxococcales bacterium]
MVAVKVRAFRQGSIALAAVLVLGGCGATNVRATEQCGSVPHALLGNEVPFAGDINCSTCCSNGGAKHGSYANGACTCYGQEAPEAESAGPAGEPAAESSDGKWDPYKRKSQPAE